MQYQEAIASLEKKFTSGNSVQVSQATITREEWEALRAEGTVTVTVDGPGDRITIVSNGNLGLGG